MKKILLTVLLLIFILPQTSAWADEVNSEITLIINDFPYVFAENDARAVLKDGRVYVPLRVVANALDCEIEWYEAVQTVVINERNYTGEPVLDNQENKLAILINGEKLASNEAIGEAFINEQGFTLVPLRAVGESLDCTVVWQDNVVLINKNKHQETVDNPNNGSHETIAPTNNTVVDVPTIFGPSTLNAEEINNYLNYMKPFLKARAENNGTVFYDYPDNIAELYISRGNKYGIRGDVALCQALKETGYFQYGGIVEPWQNNFCGLGATGVAYTEEDTVSGVDGTLVYIIPGTHGVTFATVAAGVEAHIQHLYAYATNGELPNGTEMIDPRFNHYYRGTATYWNDLNGRWAVPGDGYGESIIRDYWQKIYDYNR